MDDLQLLIGQRIRGLRSQKSMTQEDLAERAGLHNTYVGQLERGEKNATIETISRVAVALDVPLSQLFECLPQVTDAAGKESLALKCYQLMVACSAEDQERLYHILCEILRVSPMSHFVGKLE